MTLEEIEHGWEDGTLTRGEASSLLGQLSSEEIERAQVDADIRDKAREHHAARARGEKFIVLGSVC